MRLFDPIATLAVTPQPRTMRYDAIGHRLQADKELAALFEASSLIHVDRNGLRRPIEKTGVSRLPPSYRHVVVSLGTIWLRRARVKPWFLFPIALSDSYLCTSTEEASPLALGRSRLYRAVQEFRQTAAARNPSTGAAQIRRALLPDSRHATYWANAPALTLASASLDCTPLR